MLQREPFEYIEIDVDYCSLTYGQGACTASLANVDGRRRKCFNMFRHCQDQENFSKSVLTLRFCKPVQSPPPGLFFPFLQSVRATTSTVNIGGTDDKLSALGRRGTLDIQLNDAPHHDRGIDKYQAQRIDGTAQIDEDGYNPADRGTFFTKLRARWPYYANRPVRYVTGYIDGGVLSITSTRHFILTEMKIDAQTRGNLVTFKAKDILDLAGNKKAVCPKTNNGTLLSNITAGANNLKLSPQGIGNEEYPTSGRAAIGSELVSFNRSGDNVTLTGRGLSGTTAASHSEGDAFQLSYSIYKQRIDVVLRDLLVNYAGVPSGFIPFADWKAEVTRWASTIYLTTDILKPEGVANLAGELAILGVSIWWDDRAQKIRLKMIRPIDGDTVYDLTDDSAIKAVSVDDRDDDRITEISFYSVLADAADAPTRGENFDRQRFTLDILSKSPNAYADTKKLDIYNRWLNHGDDATIRIVSRRTLARLKTPPKRYSITLDAKYDAIGMTDVLRVLTRVATDETGKPNTTFMEVISRSELRAGHDFEVIAQAYIYEGRFPFIAPNGTPDYDSATASQKEQCAFIVGPSLTFSDGTPPYGII